METSPPARDFDVPPLRSQLQFTRVGSNTRWGAVIAGVLMATAVWLVLYLLGIGIGLTAIDPYDAHTLRGVGIGTGIWSLISPILALFVGGLVASRLAPTPNSLNRALHGGLVWAVASIGMIVMLYTVVMNVVGGVAATGERLAGSATSALATSVSGMDRDSFKSLGIDADQVLAPVNERLRAAGKPPVTAAQLQAAASDALNQAAGGGKLDRATMVQALARNTALTPADADEIATAIESRWTTVQRRVDEMADRAKVASLKAAEATGKALMGLSVALLLALAASIGGALLTGHRDRRAEGDAATTGPIRGASAGGVAPQSRHY